MERKNIPLYGTIPYYGGYSVTYRKEKSPHGGECSHCLHGYGDFPFDKFPDIPVINFRNNDAVFHKPDYYVEEATISPIPTNTIPLKKYLEILSDCGIEIINNN